MPDFSSAGDLFRSRILGMGLEDTPYQQQAVSGMLGGATPEQLRSFFGSPQVQQQFKGFGIDPQQFTQNIRTSPFFNQGFMQQHPLLGGALTHAMANVAATPEAPLVSGAGSGMTRAMQGAMGGNDMLRQYQLHQMMAPFGMMAGMMPTYGEERRRAIEQAIVDETKARQQAIPWQQQMQQEKEEIDRMRAEAAQMQASAAQERANVPKIIPGMGLVYPGQGLEHYEMPGMPAELGGAVRQGGPKFQPFDQGTIDAYVKEQIGMHPERQALADWRKAFIDAGVPDEQANYYAQRAFEAKSKGEHPTGGSRGATGGWTEKGASQLEQKKGVEQNAILKEYAPIREKYKNDQEWQQQDPKTYQGFMERMQQLEDQYTEAGRASGGTYPGYTYPGMKSSVPPQNPFLSPGANRGGQGSPAPTGTQQFPPDAQVDDAGNVFDAQGKYLGRQQGAATPTPTPAPRPAPAPAPQQ